MSKKQGQHGQAASDAALAAKRASAVAILLQRENLLAVHRNLRALRQQLGEAEYLAWLAAEYLGMAGPIEMSAMEFLYTLGSHGSPELADLLTDPAALAELQRIAYGAD